MRNHVGAIAGMLGGIIIAFIVAIMPGCVKTDSIEHPGTKITAVQLQKEAVDLQQGLDDEATAIQQKIQADQQADSKLVADYNGKVSAKNQQLSIASSDLAAKAQRLNSLTSVLAGAANALSSATPFNLSGILGSALTLLTVGGAAGAVVDSSAKSNALATLRAKQIDVGGAAGTTPALTPVASGSPASIPFVVPALAPSNAEPAPVLKAA